MEPFLELLAGRFVALHCFAGRGTSFLFALLAAPTPRTTSFAVVWELDLFSGCLAAAALRGDAFVDEPVSRDVV